MNQTISTEEQIEALTEGTRLAVRDYLTNFDPAKMHDLIHDAIKQGVIDAFPFPSQIIEAIGLGAEEAMKGRNHE